MSIILPALAVAFAAFCVWLGVRIVNRRERWAKRTLAAVVGISGLYVASFGPACWAVGNGKISARPVARAYWPVLVFAQPSDGYGRQLATYYAGIGTGNSDWIIFRLLNAAGLIKIGSHRTNLNHDTPYRGRPWLDL